MPQPLHRVLPKARIQTIESGAGVLQRHPEFAATIAEIIALGADVDLGQVQLLSRFWGDDRRKGIAVYLANQSALTRQKIFEAAAQACLGDGSEELAVFSLVKKAIEPARKVRNSFAHGIWRWSPELPDALLLTDVDELLLNEVGWLEAIGKLKVGDLSPEYDFFGREITLVYRMNDFKFALHQARDASNAMQSLRTWLEQRNNAIADQLKLRILENPVVARVC